MGDLVEREAYLKRGGFLQLIIILSSAFLRHGFLHSVKAYRRSRLLSCGKSEKILLPVVTNLNTPGLFCFCFFFFFAVRAEQLVGMISVYFVVLAFFFSLQSKPSVSILLNTRIRWLLTVGHLWKVHSAWDVSRKKRSSEAWGRE